MCVWVGVLISTLLLFSPLPSSLRPLPSLTLVWRGWHKRRRAGGDTPLLLLFASLQQGDSPYLKFPPTPSTFFSSSLPPSFHHHSLSHTRSFLILCLTASLCLSLPLSTGTIFTPIQTVALFCFWVSYFTDFVILNRTVVHVLHNLTTEFTLFQMEVHIFNQISESISLKKKKQKEVWYLHGPSWHILIQTHHGTPCSWTTGVQQHGAPVPAGAQALGRHQTGTQEPQGRAGDQEREPGKPHAQG